MSSYSGYKTTAGRLALRAPIMLILLYSSSIGNRYTRFFRFNIRVWYDQGTLYVIPDSIYFVKNRKRFHYLLFSIFQYHNPTIGGGAISRAEKISCLLLDEGPTRTQPTAEVACADVPHGPRSSVCGCGPYPRKCRIRGIVPRETPPASIRKTP